ncbi:MAG TPA: hypothetical protein VLG09_04245 [Candidatus Saccharimonadales bacterium]|nr:hypothetical protein [Candidatus Saccharimonadales bacterium]
MTKPPGTQSTGFDIPSVTRPEGYVMVDHRASPGIPADIAEKMGLDPKLFCEGALFEAATKRCCHCPSVVILKHDRVRERGHCRQCNDYVCDACVAASKMPDYVHMNYREVVDKVVSGKFVLSGPTSLPVLTRKETVNG